MVSRTSRVVHIEKTSWRGTRSASQIVPLKRRPRTGGSDRALGLDMAVVAGMAELNSRESFRGRVTPSARRSWSDHHSGTVAASIAQTTGATMAGPLPLDAGHGGLGPIGSRQQIRHEDPPDFLAVEHDGSLIALL